MLKMASPRLAFNRVGQARRMVDPIFGENESCQIKKITTDLIACLFVCSFSFW
jgi:hypothetical protein